MAEEIAGPVEGDEVHRAGQVGRRLGQFPQSFRGVQLPEPDDAAESSPDRPSALSLGDE